MGESVQFPMLYYTHNVVGAVNLIEAMRKHNVKNVRLRPSTSCMQRIVFSHTFFWTFCCADTVPSMPTWALCIFIHAH